MNRIVPIIALGAVAPFASAQHLDITVYESGGSLFTGAIDHDTEIITPGVRVFEGEFQNTGSSIFADEPGFDIPDGALPADSQLLLTVTAAVRLWNGSDFLSISPTDISLEFGPQSLTTPASDSTVGPMIFDLDEDGGLHDHPDFILNADITGIYLLEVQFGMSGFATSDSAWIVLNYGLDEEDHELAVEWVEENLVPAPGTLLGLSGLLALRRRRS
jgi:hypothetical protein